MHWRLVERLRATSLRTRLTLWNTVVVILLTTITLLIVRFSARSALYADCDAELRAASREIALAVQELSGDEARLVAEMRRKVVSHEERGWFLHLLTADGTTVWKSDHCPADVVNYPPVDVEQVEVVGQVGHYHYARTRIDRPSGQSYLVRVGTYTTGLDESLAVLMRLLTAMGFGLSLITPFAAYWLAGRATKPVGSMLRTAERLSPNRLSDRLPVRGTDDELDLLARTINGLLDRVARHVETQEQFVADAAHELPAHSPGCRAPWRWRRPGPTPPKRSRTSCTTCSRRPGTSRRWPTTCCCWRSRGIRQNRPPMRSSTCGPWFVRPRRCSPGSPRTRGSGFAFRPTAPSMPAAIPSSCDGS